MSVEYDQYLREHIAAVYDALKWMSDNLEIPGVTDTNFSDALWNASDHDKSKFEKFEYDAYDDYFYGGNKSYKVVQMFNYAWLHHQNKNPHHWQYWVLIQDNPEDGNSVATPLEMPVVYVLEMIADWWSFSWRKGDKYELFSWYADNEDNILLHKDTRNLVEDILNKIQDKLEEEECLEHGDTDDNKKYGVPELKKFPMPDAKHVRSAIKFFNYVDPEHEEELAKAILARMEEYGLTFDDFGVGDENRFKKYIPKE